MLLLLQTPTVDLPMSTLAYNFLLDADTLQTPRGLAKGAGLPDLRKTPLPKGDEEVRVWSGFGIARLTGLILRKRGTVWTAVRLVGGFPDEEKSSTKTMLQPPKEGWAAFLSEAAALGLWTLPDESVLPQEKRVAVLDGIGYVVELQREGRYRAYAYSNPQLQPQWPEAAKLSALANLLADAFPPPSPPQSALVQAPCLRVEKPPYPAAGMGNAISRSRARRAILAASGQPVCDAGLS